MSGPRVIPSVRAPEPTEKEWTDQLLQMASFFGWRTAHFRPARTSHGWRTAVQGDGVGFPDLLLTRRERLIAAELKVKKGKTTTEQEEWLAAFAHTGAETYVWWPKDFDRVSRILQADHDPRRAA